MIRIFWDPFWGPRNLPKILEKSITRSPPLMIEVIDLGRKRSFFGPPKSLSLSVIHIFEDDFGGKNPYPYR